MARKAGAWLRGAALAGVAIALVGIGAARHPAAAPDVVLIVIDTLRADHLPIYGYDKQTAPRLQRLARCAVVYERAISPGTWTVPAHGSFFTGRWPSFHGAERVGGVQADAYPLRADVPTLAELARAHGHRTAAFVGNGTYVAPEFGFARGFDVFESTDLGSPRALARAVTAWLAEQDGPFLLFINILDPHEPYTPPPPLDTRFGPKRPEYGDMITRVVNAGRTVTPEMRAHFVAQYDGEIALADEVVGTILDAHARLRPGRQALVVVTSDHGELLGEHGLAGHGIDPYEPEVRVPLLVRYPDARGAGTRVARRVSTAAVFATVLETLGIAPPPDVDVAPLDREHPVWIEDVTEAGARVRVGYDGRWKLIRTDGRDAAYDLDADPAEKTVRDAAAAPALRAALDAFTTIPRPPQHGPRPVIDAERAARLRALGYLD